jgi:hypothetical protein
MDLNRNQFFFLGVFVLLIGLQVRMVSAYVLNPKPAKFIAEKMGGSQPAANSLLSMTSGTDAQLRKLSPPEWLGWCLISIGAVLVLHSLALQKPG